MHKFYDGTKENTLIKIHGQNKNKQDRKNRNSA